jgi:hypothetical protein
MKCIEVLHGKPPNFLMFIVDLTLAVAALAVEAGAALEEAEEVALEEAEEVALEEVALEEAEAVGTCLWFPYLPLDVHFHWTTYSFYRHNAFHFCQSSSGGRYVLLVSCKGIPAVLTWRQQLSR